ncbi:PrsW family intramembrane metalloprotease [Corynebacterium argentoratense]|uniref:PrsW family intramembrane metalloprotease n=1 Tax=Corynebacterium argentoratense TaxID=42817 RepID=UPI001F3000D6|nr:PrsW family intramembrane metalloprotease [Corynebacterium argentoratense]MCF1712215.1 PrsW family intramembrane metalloprotease [Corynebacterium argentoratense]
MSKISFWSLWITLAIGTIVGINLLLGIGVMQSWSAVMLGVALSVVEVSLFVLLLRLLPQWPQGKSWWLLPALLWGGFASMVIISATGTSASTLMIMYGLDMFEASMGGAYPEEAVKALGVFLVLTAYRNFNRPWHGLVVGIVVGIGFEVVENTFYGGTGAVLDPVSDVAGTLSMWGMRTIFGPGIHGMLSGIAGWGIGLALFSAQRGVIWRLSQVCGWLFLAFACHFTWNIQWPSEDTSVMVMVCVGVVMYGTVIGIVAYSWKKAKKPDFAMVHY